MSGSNVVITTTIGPGAVAYIRGCLADGNRLAHKLATLLPLEEGRITAYLPRDSHPDPDRLQFGGVTSRADTEPKLVQLVAAHLAEGPNSCAVFEDAVARPGDPILSKTGALTFTFDAEVYHLIVAQTANSGVILRTIRYSTSHSFIGAMSELPQGAIVQPGAAVPEAVLDEIAARTSELVVGAWDQEGALVWRSS